MLNSYLLYRKYHLDYLSDLASQISASLFLSSKLPTTLITVFSLPFPSSFHAPFPLPFPRPFYLATVYPLAPLSYNPPRRLFPFPSHLHAFAPFLCLPPSPVPPAHVPLIRPYLPPPFMPASLYLFASSPFRHPFYHAHRPQILLFPPSPYVSMLYIYFLLVRYSYLPPPPFFPGLVGRSSTPPYCA